MLSLHTLEPRILLFHISLLLSTDPAQMCLHLILNDNATAMTLDDRTVPDTLLQEMGIAEMALYKCDSASNLSDSASSSSLRRRLCWADSSDDDTFELCDVKPFRKDDEAWRCSKSENALLVQQFGQPVAHHTLNTTLPASFSEMMSCLLDHSVQLESMLRSRSDVHMSVSYDSMDAASHLAQVHPLPQPGHGEAHLCAVHC